MCQWLIDQFEKLPNSIFTFICSTEEIKTNHPNLSSVQYRWRLFEFLYHKYKSNLKAMGIESRDIIIGPEGYQTFARVFYRLKHAPIIHIVIANIQSKYTD